MQPDRRSFLAAAGALAATPAIAAAPAVERFPVWPGPPPGGEGLSVADMVVKRSPTGPEDDIAWPHVATPMLTVVNPRRPNGAALLLIPGGGYARVATGRTGSDVARLFAGEGITVFELLYRLPHDGWAAGPDAPLQDAQRAMRVIRGQAGRRGIDPARVGAIGFSAGGHLAARTASRASLATYRSIDAADALSARPSVAGLFFPVITLTGDHLHKGSVRELGVAGDPARGRAFAAETALPADMPPTFIACTGDDPVVPTENSLVMYRALRANRTPAELMIFERGGHGLPLREPDGAVHPWPALFLRFARNHGLLA